MVAITQISTTPVAAAATSSGPASAASSATRASQPPPSTSKPADTTAQPSEHSVAQAVEVSNNALINSKNESISFGYEKRLGLLFVQVTDKSTGEVLREIPSKDFIRHAIAMRESIGLILDKKG